MTASLPKPEKIKFDTSLSFLKKFKWVKVEKVGEEKVLRLMMPISGCYNGISTDNTCQTLSSLKLFMGEDGQEGDSAEKELNLFKEKVAKLIETIETLQNDSQQILILRKLLESADKLLIDLQSFKGQNPVFFEGLKIPQKVLDYILKDQDDTSRPNFYAIHLRPRGIDPVLGIDHEKANFKFDRSQAHGATNDESYWQRQRECFVKNLMMSFLGLHPSISSKIVVRKKTKKIEEGELNNEFARSAADSSISDNELNPDFLNSSGQALASLKLSKLYAENTDIQDIFGISSDHQNRTQVQKDNIELLFKSLKKLLEQKFNANVGRFSIEQFIDEIARCKDSITELSDLITYTCPRVAELCSGEDGLDVSPFFSINITQSDSNNDGRNKLAIITQFFIAKFNQFCVAHNLCRKNLNLGEILDRDSTLSSRLVQLIKQNLVQGDDKIEDKIIEFLNQLTSSPPNSQALNDEQKERLKKEFRDQWVHSSTSQHFDDFMFVSPKPNGRVVYDKNAGHMQFDFSLFYQSQVTNAQYKPTSHCLSKLDQADNYTEDTKRFDDESSIEVTKAELINNIKELLKSPSKDKLSKVVDYLMRKVQDKFLFETDGFRIDQLLQNYQGDKDQVKKLLKIIARKSLSSADSKDLKKFQQYVDPTHLELTFSPEQLRALYVAISARHYGDKNIIINDIKGYQTAEDIAKIINIALQIKEKEDDYMRSALGGGSDLVGDVRLAILNGFQGIQLTQHEQFNSQDITIDKSGKAYLKIKKDSAEEIKKTLDHLTKKFEKIYYLSTCGDQQEAHRNLARQLFVLATSLPNPSNCLSTEALNQHRLNQGLLPLTDEDSLKKYKVTRALEIAMRYEEVEAPGRVSFAGVNGYRVELGEKAHSSLNRKFFSKKISVDQSKKIYQLVRYLCPEETYKEMMRLNNSGWGVPEKIEFALKALGIPFSGLRNNDNNGFKVVIDQAFIDFINQIPQLSNPRKLGGSPSLSVDECALVYQAFNKKFSDDQALRNQLSSFSNHPTPQKLEFALDKLGIPHFGGTSRDDVSGIDIQVPESLVKDLQSYLRDSSVPVKPDLILSCYDDRIKEYQFSSKVNGLEERVLFGELNLARLNLESQNLTPVKIEKPKLQITIKKVRAHGVKSAPPATADKNCRVICPSDVLEQFRELMSQTQVLGSNITDPYTGETIIIPSDHQELQPWHLHLLARNESENVTGVFNFGLYNQLMTDDQITRLRCLVKATTLVGLDSVKAYGGYPNYDSRREISPPQKIIVIDQSGLQWQNDHRNTGGMFFYPDQTANKEIISGGDYGKFQEFQKEMYQAMYGVQRPENCDSDNIEVNWLRVEGKIDLKGVSLGIKEEFLQALNSAIASSDFLDDGEKIVFRFLKAGMGFFRSGILPQYSQSSEDKIKIARLENARLRGIMDALQELDNVLPKELNIREKFFKKVKALQLPFSKTQSSSSSSPSDQLIEEQSAIQLSILAGIKDLANKLGIEHRGDQVIDACKPEQGFIVATTNTGDPHALLGNEGEYQSVDAAIASNLVNPKKFHFIEKNFSQVEKNITGHRFGQKKESQEVAVPQTDHLPSALSPLTGLRKVLTPKLEFYGMELISEKYNYRPIADEDADYKEFSKKIVEALYESFNEAISKQTSSSPNPLNDDKKEELLIAIMQIADKNRGIGNCRPETIKEQIKKLMNEYDEGAIDFYYKVAVNFSANFQRRAIAKTGNIDSRANHQVDLRLFRVCTWQNMQDICLKLFEETAPGIPLAEDGDDQEKKKKYQINKKIISLTETFKKNSQTLNGNMPKLDLAQASVPTSAPAVIGGGTGSAFQRVGVSAGLGGGVSAGLGGGVPQRLARGVSAGLGGGGAAAIRSGRSTGPIFI